MSILNPLPADVIKANFKHKGLFLFVPVYLGAEEEGMNLEVRNGVPDFLMDVATALFDMYVFVRQIFNPEYEPFFPIFITGDLPHTKQ